MPGPYNLTTMAMPIIALVAGLGFAKPVDAATVTLSGPMLAARLKDGSGLTQPVIMRLTFDETTTGSSVDATGTLSYGDDSQAGVSARISFSTLAGSGPANGTHLGFSIVLDDQPFEVNSFFVPGRGTITTVADINPDLLPFNIDVNSFTFRLYGAPPVDMATSSMGDLIQDYFDGAVTSWGQGIRFFSAQSNSFVYGKYTDFSQVSYAYDAGSAEGSAGAAVPLPAGLPLLLAGLGGLAFLRRRSV